MDRGSGKRSVVDGASARKHPVRVFESSVTSETRLVGVEEATVTTAVVSSVTLEDVWSEFDANFSDTVISNGKCPQDAASKQRRDYCGVDTVIISSDGKSDSIKRSAENGAMKSSECVKRTIGNGSLKSNDISISSREKSSTSSDKHRDIFHSAIDIGNGHVRTDCLVISSNERRANGHRTSNNGESDIECDVDPTNTCGDDVEIPPDVPAGARYRPTFEEFIPVRGSLDDTIKELNEMAGRPLVPEESPPRVSRLLGLLSRDEERRARAQVQQQASIDESGEWDKILRDVLASVSELERWRGEGGGDVTPPRDAAAPSEASHSGARMEAGEALSPKGETPTKVKSLRFKLDPDIFDVPSDDSFYEDEDPRGWKRHHKAYLDMGDEPVQLVSVHASVVPAGQKMVARPVGIDLRVRLTDERQSKRAHVGSSPSQAKRRSPVSESRVGWCQELSPVTENVDWRETFTKEVVPKTVPNGILKSPSPKLETVSPPVDSSNPFKGQLTNGENTTDKTRKPVSNGVTKWNPQPRKLSLPRKKFEPDPEAIERITGYKGALSKPPLPPPSFHKSTPLPVAKTRADMARKQYLDSKNAHSAPKNDGSAKFQQFLSQAQSDRARVGNSVPDLAAIERAVNERWARERGGSRESPAREDTPRSVDNTPSSRGSTPDDAWSSYVQSCRKHLGRRSQSMTYLETEIDLPSGEDIDKWRSTTALDEPDAAEPPRPVATDDSDFEQSREDLDDSGRARSEHELRIQKSLQSMPLPDWYKRSDKPKTGFLLKPHQEKEKKGWAAAKSLASSTSSLASCGLKRPVHSLRSSRENIPWSRSSTSPDGPTLSLALARAFREPYLGWRARASTTSSGVSSSSRTSPPSWCNATTDEDGGVSFDGEDAFGRTSSLEPPSLDDTGADVATVSMDTGELAKLPGGEDTCDDINNMSMDTCEVFDAGVVPDAEDETSSPRGDTGDDIDQLSTDTAEDSRRGGPRTKRYSYSRSIYNSEWEEEESRGERKAPRDPSPPSGDPKVIWIESSFVGSRTTTSIVVLPDDRPGAERPASR